jgi:hypothetical protein
MFGRRAFLGGIVALGTIGWLSRPAKALQYVFPQPRWLVYSGVRDKTCIQPHGPESWDVPHFQKHEPIHVSDVVLIDRGRWLFHDNLLTRDDFQKIEEILGVGVFNWHVVRGKKPPLTMVADAGNTPLTAQPWFS